MSASGALTTQELAELRDNASRVPETLRDWWLAYLASHTLHYDSVLARLPQPDDCGRLLEVGSVPGHLSILLARRGYEISCVDLAPERIPDLWSHHGIDIHTVNVETERLPFEDGAFRCVLFTEILEHLRIGPIFAMQEAARVLAPEGQLVVSVPNITPRDRLGFLFGGDYQGDFIAEFEKLERFGHMGHIRLYSLAEVSRLLAHVGFANIEIRREGKRSGRFLHRILFPWRDAFCSHAYFVARRGSESSPKK